MTRSEITARWASLRSRQRRPAVEALGREKYSPMSSVALRIVEVQAQKLRRLNVLLLDSRTRSCFKIYNRKAQFARVAAAFCIAQP
jgi:hypothetical protein